MIDEPGSEGNIAQAQAETAETAPTRRQSAPKGPPAGDGAVAPGADASSAEEVGGPQGPEPTRFGDWERKGRCIDF